MGTLENDLGCQESILGCQELSFRAARDPQSILQSRPILILKTIMDLGLDFALVTGFCGPRYPPDGTHVRYLTRFAIVLIKINILAQEWKLSIKNTPSSVIQLT